MFFHIIMKRELKEKLPNWCFDDKEYATVLQGDLDSLLGCAIEEQVNGNEVNHFYNFNKLYVMDKNVRKPLLGIDLALHNGRSWCNHVVKISEDDYVNPRTANLNVVMDIHSGNYFQKYAGSTALLMWSFYGLPLPETEVGKKLLLCIDSGFLGHYDNRFKQAHNKYLRLMGFEELIDILNNTSKSEFFELQQRYKTKASITMDKDGYLQTNLPLESLSKELGIQLELPQQQFKQSHQWKSKMDFTYNGIKSKDQIGEKLISFALTGRNKFKYTYIA